jgi:hypothetical protein
MHGGNLSIAALQLHIPMVWLAASSVWLAA